MMCRRSGLDSSGEHADSLERQNNRK